MSEPQRKPAPSLRTQLRAADVDAIRAIVAGTEMFTEAEVEIAAELALDRLERGESSEYAFVCIDDAQGLAGYACYGPTPGTDRGYDLYWIAVARNRQGGGIGQALIAFVEEALKNARARHVIVETSLTERYAPTRRFYERGGYERVAEIADFYRVGDGKVIYRKVFGT